MPKGIEKPSKTSRAIDRSGSVARGYILPQGRIIAADILGAGISSCAKKNSYPKKSIRWLGLFVGILSVGVFLRVVSFSAISALHQKSGHSSHSFESLSRQLKDYPDTDELGVKNRVGKNRLEHTKMVPSRLVPNVLSTGLSLVATNKQPISIKTVEDRVAVIVKKHGKPHVDSRALARVIVSTSYRYQIDPLFLAAVIKSESAFDTHAVSQKGARGLMQLMPRTAEWIAKSKGLKPRPLSDVAYNIQIGIEYLRHLKREYDDNVLFALVAYNWGPGHVKSATSGTRRVPRECMKYALTILRDYHEWKQEIV